MKAIKTIIPVSRGGAAAGVFLGLLLLAGEASAGRLILRIKAVNPIEKSQVVTIKSTLPQGISSNDVLNLDGLEMGYDVRSDSYYVTKDVPLGPKQVQTFDVELNDVWKIPERDLDAIVTQAKNLSSMLVGTDFHGSANVLRQQVESAVERIRQSQKENAIGPGVPPIRHIAAHEASLKLLGRVRRDVGQIENLVLETGQDPGRLIGEDRRALRLRRDIELPDANYGTALYRITVQNSSPSESRTVEMRRELPAEIGPEDVLDSAGLLVGQDADSGVTYIYGSGIELEPGATATYDVKIRDKWNINLPRVAALSANASNLLSRISKRESFASIESSITSVMDDLGAVAKEKGPEALSPSYVAFYRDQARRIDELEQRINRIRAALIPIEKPRPYGFPVKPPTMKTTWLIIYIILGFLALLSLLFFLRWYGRTRDEQMWAELSKQSETRETKPPPSRQS